MKYGHKRSGNPVDFVLGCRLSFEIGEFDSHSLLALSSILELRYFFAFLNSSYSEIRLAVMGKGICNSCVIPGLSGPKRLPVLSCPFLSFSALDILGTSDVSIDAASLGTRQALEKRRQAAALRIRGLAIWTVLEPRIARYGTVRRCFLYSMALRSDNLARYPLAQCWPELRRRLREKAGVYFPPEPPPGKYVRLMRSAG